MSPEKIHELSGLGSIGRYIDVGAFDGVFNSKTKYFADIGWEGIAIEPNPLSYAKLDANRTCEKKIYLLQTTMESVISIGVSKRP